MIERFNFYDVYGYFVPGFILLALLWIPFGIVRHLWPPTELGSALVAVVIAYVIGHVLRIVSTDTLPSTIKDRSGNRRYPSEVFLDSESSVFSKPLKERLAKLVKDDFEIDLAIERSPARRNDQEFTPIGRQRQDAFFLCRGTLIREKIAAYPEQFEGMYTLMRGLATAGLLAFAYFAGWASAITQTRFLTLLTIGVVAISLAYCLSVVLVPLCSGSSDSASSRIDKTFLVVFSLVFLGSGHMFGRGCVALPRQAVLLAGFAALSLLLAVLFFTSYKRFAQEFAKAVWRDYAGRGKASAQPVSSDLN